MSRDDGSEQFLRSHSVLRETLKLPGFFLFTLIVVAIVIWKHRAKLHAGLFVFISTALSGVNQLIKWIAGRTRPFKPPDGSGAWRRLNYIHLPIREKIFLFPPAMRPSRLRRRRRWAILWPRFRWAFYALVTVVAIEAHRGKRALAQRYHRGRGAGDRRGASDPRDLVGSATDASLMSENSIYLSLVIPAYNEQESVPTLLTRVEASLAPSASRLK